MSDGGGGQSCDADSEIQKTEQTVDLASRQTKSWDDPRAAPALLTGPIIVAKLDFAPAIRTGELAGNG